MSIYKIDKLPNCQDDMVPLERKKNYVVIIVSYGTISL